MLTGDHSMGKYSFYVFCVSYFLPSGQIFSVYQLDTTIFLTEVCFTLELYLTRQFLKQSLNYVLMHVKIYLYGRVVHYMFAAMQP